MRYLGNDGYNISTPFDPDALDRVPRAIADVIPGPKPVQPDKWDMGDMGVPILPKWTHAPLMIGGALVIARIFAGPPSTWFKKGKR